MFPEAGRAGAARDDGVAMSSTTHLGAPALSIDPFSEESLADPIPIDEAIRETGEVVYLEQYDTWFTGRHARVEKVMRDFENFESGAGTGLTNVRRDENWRKPSVILENDPPSHTRYRRIMTSVLSQRVVRRLRASFQAEADALVARVIGGEVDAAKQLAEDFPMSVLPDALGFQQEGRHHLLPYSAINFTAAGPRNERYRRAVEAAGDAPEYVAWQMRRENLAPGGLGQTIYGFADAGDITEEDAGMLVRTFLSAGLDTTIFGIQAAFLHLARNPDAWARLKADPSLARQVFEETLRCTPSSPFIGRTTTREVRIGDAVIPAEKKLVVALAAAGRDPRRWERPEVFDLDRDTSGHLAFGTGIHGCVGQMMARMEATCLLTALAQQAGELELVGEPEVFFSNWLRGYARIPMRITRRAGAPAAAAAPVASAPRKPRRAAAADDSLTLQVAERIDEAEGVAGLVLTDPQGRELPPWRPGAHIDLLVERPAEESLVRQYSLCGDPSDRTRYRIAVLREDDGAGGSVRIHEAIRQGQLVRVSAPRDNFAFESAGRLVFVAGGIGITPILPMLREAEASGHPWELHYAGRSAASMAFADALDAHGDCVHRYARADGRRMAVGEIVSRAAADGARVYACGPQRLLDAIEAAGAETGCDVRVERFVNDREVNLATDRPFDVELALTRKTIRVEPGQSILGRVREAGVPAPSSCEGGTCGTCETFVLDGDPDHRDAVLSAVEREEGEVMMICVSRCRGERLVLEL